MNIVTVTFLGKGIVPDHEEDIPEELCRDLIETPCGRTYRIIRRDPYVYELVEDVAILYKFNDEPPEYLHPEIPSDFSDFGLPNTDNLYSKLRMIEETIKGAPESPFKYILTQALTIADLALATVEELRQDIITNYLEEGRREDDDDYYED